MTNDLTTTDVTTGVRKPDVPLPPLPESLAALIEDHTLGRSPWSPPSHIHLAPLRPAIAQSIAATKALLTPASPDEISVFLGEMAVCLAAPEGTAQEWTTRTRVYRDLLGHYPRDVWAAAARKCLLTNRFFPSISELETIMRDLAAPRHALLSRLERLAAVRDADPGEYVDPAKAQEILERVKANIRRVT